MLEGSSGRPGRARTAIVCSNLNSPGTCGHSHSDLLSQEQIKAEESNGEDKGEGQEERLLTGRDTPLAAKPGALTGEGLPSSLPGPSSPS